MRADHPTIFRAKLEVIDCPVAMTAAEVYRVNVRLRNESPVDWPSLYVGIPDVSVTYHWLQPSGETHHYSGLQTRLPQALRPGETAAFPVLVEAPAEPGSYILQWDLLIEQVAWFSTRGWQGPLTEVRVVEGISSALQQAAGALHSERATCELGTGASSGEPFNSVDKGTQLLLRFQYQALVHQGSPLPALSEVEFRNFSQNGEDGILLYLFSLIGEETRRAVEICAGDGIECNSANLIVNHGWTGLLVDGDPGNVSRGRTFYARCKDTWMWPPVLIEAWVTTENVNALIREHGFEGEIDLLSLDMDGMDYWIWQAIDCISPRVVVLEYQDIWGPERAVTVPYDPDFRADFVDGLPDYAGASLSAFVKLGRSKGYRLVGSQRYGFNAFFVRNGVSDNIPPEVPAATCFTHPKVQHGMENRLPRVAQLPWVDV